MSGETGLLIRAAVDGDGAALAAIYGPVVVNSPASFEEVPPTSSEMSARIVRGSGDFPWLVAQNDHEVLGYAYAGVFRARPAYRWTAEVSVYVRDGCRGRGVGKALYGSLLACLRLQGFRTAVAGATLPNAASVKLHERVGFTPVGVYHHVGFKLGRWHDVGWFELALQELDEPPAEPRRFADIRHTPEGKAAVRSGATPGASTG